MLGTRCSVAKSCLTVVTPWTAACQASLSFTISCSWLKFMSIDPICYLNLSSSAPLFSSCPKSFPASGFFSSESALHIRWPKCWSFSFTISPSNEYSGLISFRIDWFGLLAVQGTLKSLLQHHNSKASVLWCSAFLMVQLSHLYMTTGKTTALIIWIFVSKMMSFLFNVLSRFVIALLPKGKHLLISWLQSPSAVIFGAQENKICQCFYFLPSVCHEVKGLHDMILFFWMLNTW